MMSTAMILLVALVFNGAFAAAADGDDLKVQVQAWCDNSFRVQFLPSTLLPQPLRAAQSHIDAPSQGNLVLSGVPVSSNTTSSSSSSGSRSSLVLGWKEDAFFPIVGDVALGVFHSQLWGDTVVAPRGMHVAARIDDTYMYVRPANLWLLETRRSPDDKVVHLYHDQKTHKSLTTTLTSDELPKESEMRLVAMLGYLAGSEEAAQGHVTPPAALISDNCTPGPAVILSPGSKTANGNLRISMDDNRAVSVTRVSDSQTLLTYSVSFAASTPYPGYTEATVMASPGNASERFFGLGQGGWVQPKGDDWCAMSKDSPQVVVPLQRNGQTIDLHQRKFFVSIPYVYSTAGYGMLFNMPGYSYVSFGAFGTGGSKWFANATYSVDMWISGEPADSTGPDAIYKQYADATGHAPALREDAMLFWQSRNRYRTSQIAIDVAKRYNELDLPVGVFVIDYYNQKIDGDYRPNPACYPSIKNLTSEITAQLGASTVFSLWPEAKEGSGEYDLLNKTGCLINSDLGGRAIDTTPEQCRTLIWSEFMKPRYYDQGVSAFWLDETDGEGTTGGDGNHGYDTSYGPAAFASNLWVNSWISTYTDPVAKLGDIDPLVLTRGIWAGGAKHGAVLWSSDIESTFEELTAQANLGVHASLSGVPWWTSDVGGYGCGNKNPDNSTYMQELIVRWYQFGTFCSVFRTHGCRNGSNPEPAEPDECNVHRSCGANEVWSYGKETQPILEKYIRMRATMKPYISELAKNVTERGVPTMRPLWWEFPEDAESWTVDDQFLLGPDLLVAPVTKQGVTARDVYFPSGEEWVSIWDPTEKVKGGEKKNIAAPLDTIPVYTRRYPLF